MIDVRTETIITVAKAAKRLSKCAETVRSMIRRGDLEGILIAGKLHTSLEAIERASEPAAVEERRPTQNQLDREAARREAAALKYLRSKGLAR